VTRERVGADDRVAVPSYVKFRAFDDEVVLLDLNGGQYFALNATGTSIWQALAGGRTPREAAAALVEEFETDRERALFDCIALAEDLIERGLLERK
jgi:Coenzyme PQQ synthesis protein D (PqqD)